MTHLSVFDILWHFYYEQEYEREFTKNPGAFWGLYSNQLISCYVFPNCGLDFFPLLSYLETRSAPQSK